MLSLPLWTFWLLVHFASSSIFRAQVSTGAWTRCPYPRIVRKVYDCPSEQIQWLTSSWVILLFAAVASVSNAPPFFSLYTRYYSRLTQEPSPGTQFLHSFNNVHSNLPYRSHRYHITASLLSLLWSLWVIVLLVFSSKWPACAFLVPYFYFMRKTAVAGHTFIRVTFYFCLGRCKSIPSAITSFSTKLIIYATIQCMPTVFWLPLMLAKRFKLPVRNPTMPSSPCSVPSVVNWAPLPLVNLFKVWWSYYWEIPIERPLQSPHVMYCNITISCSQIYISFSPKWRNIFLFHLRRIKKRSFLSV